MSIQQKKENVENATYLKIIIQLNILTNIVQNVKMKNIILYKIIVRKIQNVHNLTYYYKLQIMLKNVLMNVLQKDLKFKILSMYALINAQLNLLYK